MERNDNDPIIGIDGVPLTPTEDMPVGVADGEPAVSTVRFLFYIYIYIYFKKKGGLYKMVSWYLGDMWKTIKVGLPAQFDLKYLRNELPCRCCLLPYHRKWTQIEIGN